MKINYIDSGFYKQIRLNLQARLFYHLAPLLFGNKPAMTQHLQCDNFNNFFNAFGPITAMNKQVLFHLIKSDVSRGHLILFYRSDRLAQVLQLPENRRLLIEFGYHPEYDLKRDFYTLKSRMVQAFPHEIGIFLGIPVADVVGFLRNNGRKYLLNGYWKVYHDPQSAVNIFAGFDRAKQMAAEYLIKNYLC